jgi:uncharacterized protein YlxW (UPF0749 family)
VQTIYSTSSAQPTSTSTTTAVQAAVTVQPNSSSIVDNSIVNSNTSNAALPAHIVEWMATMSTAMQQLQLKVAVSEQKCQSFAALEARVQDLEISNAELRQQNTRLQRRLDDTETRCDDRQRENEDLKVQLNDQLPQVHAQILTYVYKLHAVYLQNIGW